MGMAPKDHLNANMKMMNMEDKKDALEKYKSSYPPLEKKEIPKLVKQLKTYNAVARIKGSEKTDRFRIYDAEGNFDFYSYSHLIEGSFRNGILTLNTTTRSFALSGKNLDQVAELFSDRKVKALYQFNPAIHQPPAEPKEIIIEKIEREE